MAYRDLVVIGVSAGGIEALQTLVGGLPSDLQAAVLIVLHTSSRAESLLPHILGRAGPLPVEHPRDGTVVRNGHIYIAPPDFHMMIDGNVLRILQGPRENRHRPAIDPLFRPAAVARGNRTIGIILTGLLDDGTTGLMVLKQRGGAAIVQDPATAMFSAMPKNALEQVPDATVLPVEEIAAEIVRLTREEIPDLPGGEQPEVWTEKEEVRFIEQELPQMENGEHPGRPSAFACPDCGGVLWELEENGFLRFRCRVGHAFTARHLSAEQQYAIETALWSALRALEESAALYQRLADRARDNKQEQSASRFQDRAEDTHSNANVLREFLSRVNEGAAD